MEALEEIQDRILDRLHAGEAVDRERILSQYPDHADALATFLDVVDLIEDPGEVEEPAPTRLGDFRIVREVGRGGMGVVYEAEQLSLKRRVALKVLPPALRADRRLLARFRREAEAAGRLRHPNVVPVFSIGEAGGAPFFAMELVEGSSLGELLDRRRKGEEAGSTGEPEEWKRWIVETVAAIADALAYAHGRGILHRDVKPGNIMIEADGTPRLTDFGLAIDLEGSSLTVVGEVLGSPRYMSPEQAVRREKPLDARTDIYSLAVTLYELLTYRLPYEGTTSHEFLAALTSGRVVPPRRVDPEISPLLEAVVMRALRQDPAERYESASAFADDLRSALDGGVIEAPLVRSGVRRRVVGWASAIVLLLAVVLLASGVFRSSDKERYPRKLADAPARPAIERAADGIHEDGSALLESILTIDTQFRHVVARNEAAECRISVAAEGVDLGLVSNDVGLVCIVEQSINGGPWRFPRQCGVELAQLSGQYSVVFDLREELRDELAQSSVTVAHRVTARLLRRPFDRMPISGRPISASNFEPRALEGRGTAIRRIFGPETLFVYDEFPEDYPSTLSNAELNARMEEAFTPLGIRFGEMGSAAANRESLFANITFPSPESLDLIPVAAELLLYREGDEELLGRAQWVIDRAQKLPLVVGIFFDVSESSEDQRESFLREIESGDLERVRLVSSPSRAVALARASIDRYWDQTLDVTVAVDSK